MKRLMSRVLAFLSVCPPEEGCYKVRYPGGAWICVKCGA